MGLIPEWTRADDLPFMARAPYRAEIRYMLLWGIFAGLVEGNTPSIVAAKTFQASDLLVTVVFTTPMLANLLNVLWGALTRGRPRQASFIALSLAAALSVAAVSLIPPGSGWWAGWVFAGLLAAARILLAGVITLRTGYWNANYPQSHRALITGRLQSLRFLVAILAALAIAALFDRDARHYVWVFPLVAVLGALALIPIWRIPVRGERRALRAFHAQLARGGEQTAPRRLGFLENLCDALRVLSTDRPFARYCTAQYFLGSANFMMEAILAIYVTKQLHLSDLLPAAARSWLPDYLIASLLLDVIPSVVLLATMAPLARWFDQVGVLRFRVVNTAFWMAGTILASFALLAAAAPGAVGAALGLVLLAACRVVVGIGKAGGSIAWNLGHLHFSRGPDADLYMSIHVTLTGIRGIIMPFVGVAAFQALGWWAMLGAVVLNVVAHALFRRLANEEQAWAAAQPRTGEARGAVGLAESD